MAFDLEAVRAAAGAVTPELVKEHLPILFVMEANGHYPARTEAGRYKFFSPFRHDNDPSFDVFADAKGGLRWGDYAEGSQGDVLDLVSRFFEQAIGRKASFPEMMDECRKYIEQLKEKAWTGPTVVAVRSFDLDAAIERYAAASVEPDMAVIEGFLAQRKDLLQDMDPEWLHSTFRIGVEENRLIVPYLNRAGDLVAYKHRVTGGPMKSAPGAGIYDDVLYGEWLDTDPSRPVVLCEGETDTWIAKWQLGDNYTVLGLPTGGGAQPKQAHTLKDRTVYLAFDQDKTGVGASRRWAAALEARVLLVPVPQGKDLAQCPNLLDMIGRSSLPTLPPDEAFEATTRGYYRPAQNDKQAAKQVSTWTFTPHRVLYAEDGGSVYEGVSSLKIHEVAIGNGDMLNTAALKKWSAKIDGSWLGTDTDCQVLQAMLQSEAVFLPTGRMTQIAGLHDGQFVWPGGQLGHDRWAYVPPVNDARLAGQLTLKAGRPVVGQLAVLRHLHQRDVMDPILCWLAMAPLRPLMPGRAFPVLTITGGSGTGKSTLTEAVVRVFSGSAIQLNLTSTTPHAVDSYISSTNSFPVHFDEYRPGARKEAIDRLNQLLRDVYTMQPSARGGMNRNNVSEVSQLVPSAPTIVTGEDAFHETSHTERMILVSLPKDGRNPKALEAVEKMERGPFAYAYLKWLHETYIEDGKTALAIEPTGDEGLPSRVRYNLGVLHFGWKLLQAFVAHHGSVLEGEPDFSLVTQEAVEAASSNPIRDAILWAMGETDMDTGVGEVDADVWIRPETFVAYINKKGTFVLPGGSKAVRKFLATKYDATEAQVSVAGRLKSVLLVAYGRLVE